MRVTMLLRNPFTRDARVLREARTLAAGGHDVTVLALDAPGLPPREQLDGFTVERAVHAGAVAGPTIRGATGGAAGGASSARSPARRRLPRPSAAVWVRDRVLARRFAAAALARPSDVYHAHDLNTLEPAVQAARAHHARLVYDAHELYPDLTGFTPGERTRWMRLERRLIGEADVVICPSAGRARALAERYGITEPTVVMNAPAATRPVDASASPLHGLRRKGETLLVYAGGYTPNRGLENVVRAVERLPGCRLVMIGWGPLEATLRAMAGGRVTFLDAVGPDEVIGVVAGGDIGIASYLPIGLNNELAAPNKLGEYLHAGLAVAVSDLPDFRAAVTEHGVGVLFDASDAGSIAKAVGELLEPERLADAKAKAREAAAGFTWERQAAVLLDVYEGLR